MVPDVMPAENSGIIRRGKQQYFKDMIKSSKVLVPQMSALWKRKVYDEIGGLNTDFEVLLDWDYFI